MRRIPLFLSFSLVVCALAGTLAWAAAPVVDYVSICPGRDTDAPDWANYHQAVWVLVSDADGAGDIASVTITDPSGGAHTVTPTGGWAYWRQEDDYSVAVGWCDWNLLLPPASGCYTITATDTGGNPATLLTPPVPEVSEVHPEPLTPPMDTVICDTAPTFEWDTSGLPCAYYWVDLEEEGTVGQIWSAELGERCEPVVQVPYPGGLQANHSYFWEIQSFYPVDDGVSDPRVAIWTIQRTRARFTVHGDWPEIPPVLPGKIAYATWAAGPNVGTEAQHPDWGISSIMAYNTDPTVRTWLGPTGAWAPDWSPDGGKLLYAKSGRLWIDPVDGSGPVEVPGLAAWGDSRWAPDGQRVVCSVWVGLGPWWESGHRDHDIWVAHIDGSSVYPLVESEYDDRYPVWSPDGLWIAYRKLPHEYPLWLVRYDGTDHHPLIADGAVGYPAYVCTGMGEHAWSPDGSKLAGVFWAQLPGAPFPPESPEDWIMGIGVMSRDGGPVTPVFVAPPGVICCAAPHSPKWSPDGTQIVFTSGHHLADPAGYREFEPRNELWLVNADGSGEPVQLTYDQSQDFYVSWWAPNTEPGTDVSVVSGDTTVTFETVTGSGTTTAVTFDDPPGPEPQGFQFLGDYYDVSTDAEIGGVITIEIHYDDADVPGGEEEWLSLLHWETDHWEDITVRPIDTVNNIIRGQCAFLSAFGIAQMQEPVFGGFCQPINADGSSVFKCGRTIPVKFQLSSPLGDAITDAVCHLETWQVSSEILGSVPESVEAAYADVGDTFRYCEEGEQYVYNLSTKGMAEGTWVLRVTTEDLAAFQATVLIGLR